MNESSAEPLRQFTAIELPQAGTEQPVAPSLPLLDIEVEDPSI